MPAIKSYETQPSVDCNRVSSMGSTTLDLSKATTETWALRLPRFIAERWRSLGDEEFTLGSLKIGLTGDTIKLFIDPKLPANIGLPIEYDLRFMNLSRMSDYVFTELEVARSENMSLYEHKTTPSKNAHLVGRVASLYNIHPVDTPALRNFHSSRLAESNKQVRNIKIIDSTMTLPSNRIQKTSPIKESFRVRKDKGKKAVRMEKSVLQDHIFECFSNHKYWSLGVLREELEQPEAWLKKVLNEVAYCVKAGAFNGKWRLKQEYEKELC